MFTFIILYYFLFTASPGDASRTSIIIVGSPHCSSDLYYYVLRRVLRIDNIVNKWRNHLLYNKWLSLYIIHNNNKSTTVLCFLYPTSGTRGNYHFPVIIYRKFVLSCYNQYYMISGCVLMFQERSLFVGLFARCYCSILCFCPHGLSRNSIKVDL